MTKTEGRLPYFKFNAAREHFETVHEPIARGKLAPESANINLYARLGQRYISVLGRAAGIGAEKLKAAEDYLAAMQGKSISEIIKLSPDLVGFDLSRATDAVKQTRRLDTSLAPLIAEKIALEELYELIKEPWPIEAGSKKEKKSSERAKSQRPKQDRTKRTGWVATDGTEYFLGMPTKDLALERKLQANKVLTGGGSNLHPAILSALAAGISLEEVAKHSGIPSKEIEEKLAADYENFVDSEQESSR